jgi:hypothetical protein
MNSFDIRLGLCDSRGTDLRRWLALRSHDDGKVELVLIEKAVKPKAANEETALGIVETPNLVKTIGAIITLAGGQHGNS